MKNSILIKNINGLEFTINTHYIGSIKPTRNDYHLLVIGDSINSNNEIRISKKTAEKIKSHLKPTIL